MRKFLVSLFCLLPLICPASPIKVVILGASNATGQGASDYAHSWAAKYENLLTNASPANSLVNLAVAGYATADILPTGPAGHNITNALALNPTAVIISITGNDYAAMIASSVIRTNFINLYNQCVASNVLCWISGPFPDNVDEPIAYTIQADAMWQDAYFGIHSIQIWTPFALSGQVYCNPIYLTDPSHINDLGHELYFEILTNAVPYAALQPAVIGQVVLYRK